MHTANERPGPHFYTLTVNTRGLQVRSEQLIFRVTLPARKVSIEPAEVYFYQLNGQPDERTVYVTDEREQEGRLRITGVESLSPLVSAQVLPEEPDDRGRTRIPIRLAVPGNVPPGRETTLVRMTTSDPEFPQLAFPVLIEGRRQVYGPPMAEGAIDIFEVIAGHPPEPSASRD
jgi:hypothetical protein